jgi:uncharacterized protein YkwD
MLETKSRKLTGIIATMVVSLVVFANISAASASEITSKKMVELTNQSRVDAGLNPLDVNSKLMLAAQRKADDMFANQYFEHISPDGVTPWHWFNMVGYDYTYAAENLAIDFTTAEGTHSALMKSTGHRENILGANYEDIGIAAVSGNFNGKESTIVVEEFGASKNREQKGDNDAFYETSTRQNDQNNPVIEVSKANVEAGCGQNCGLKQENKEESYGKIIPEIYSIRDQRSLKKVYAENIYWKNADKDGCSFLDSSKARLKSLLKGWTNGNCCSAGRQGK